MIVFLKKGIENHETNLLLLNKDANHQSHIRSILKLHDLDIDKLYKDGLLITILNKDWYLSFENTDNRNQIAILNIKKFYRNGII